MSIVLVALVLLSCTPLRGDFACTIDCSHSKEAIIEHITQEVPEPFTLGTLLLNSDNHFSKQELAYLLGARQGQTVTPEALASAVNYLCAKEQFQTITIKTEPGSKGVKLWFDLKAHWILADISFSGVPLGKTQYLQYYDIQPGEPFSEEKHEASLEKLQQAFYNMGYKNFTCVPTIKRDKASKRVYVSIACNKGKQFTINQLQVSVASIKAEGTRALQASVEQLLQKHLNGKGYCQELINSATKMAQEYIIESGYTKSSIKLQEAVDSKNNRVALYFTINVGKKRNFTVLGNHFFSDHELQKMITKFGHSVGLLPSSLLAQDIVEQYHKKGFWNVQVSDSEHDDGAFFFVIKEGIRAVIKEVVVKGTEHYAAQTLMKKFFSGLIGRPFDASLLQKELDRLLMFYRQQGFLDVVVLKKEYEQIETSASYRLVLVIDEGKQTFLQEVLFDDEYKALAKKKEFYVPRNKIPFDQTVVAKQHDVIADYFKSKGYLNVKADPTLIKDGDAVTISWHITKGEPIQFGKVVLKGSASTAHKTVLTTLGVTDGMRWDKDRLQLGYLRLKELDVFKQIRIHPLQSSEPFSRDLMVYLQEDDPFEVRVRAGFQQVSKNFALKKGSTYKAGVSFLWRNPTKHGDLLRFDADFTRFEQRIDVAYRVPGLLRIPLMTTIKGYANDYTQPLAAGSRKTLYRVTQEGVLASFSSQTRHTSTGLTMGVEWSETKDISEDLAAAIHFKADLISKKIPFIFIEPSLFVDLLDDKINPTKGLFFAASLKGMFPLRTSSYFVKLLVEKGMFFPVIKHHSIICGARIRFGHIFKTTFSKIMPPERFYLGGANSLRGYLPDACPPLGTFTDDAGVVQRVPQGGKSMVNMNVELRVPVTKKIDWVLFQDFGVLVEDIQSLSHGNNNLAATGLGIRYQTSIGPLRFDIGWKWRKPFPEDAGYAWFLTFGHAF